MAPPTTPEVYIIQSPSTVIMNIRSLLYGKVICSVVLAHGFKLAACFCSSLIFTFFPHSSSGMRKEVRDVGISASYNEKFNMQFIHLMVWSNGG